MVVPHGHPRIAVQYDADLPQGQTRILRGFGLKMAETRWLNFVCNNDAEGSRKTSQESFELSL